MINPIHHFHKDQNAPCIPYPVPPPPKKKMKGFITIVFDFSWDDCNTKKKSKTKVMQKFGG